MGVRKETYCKERIERLKKHLELYYNLGSPIDYEIVIDNFKTVRRTNNLSYFESYKSFIEKDTKEMMVRLFAGKSNNCDKVIFYLENPLTE